ncbi:MAG: hypothetical protein BWZ03_00426 [bacterium ADurb.BinA186]|jgi:hypothetical protein|nr:MAG: hypothetical protein BWZ03_00426 [bacterium ADurb.BinA186]
MKYQYKVIHESEEKNLETELNALGQDGWKVASVVWDYNQSLFVATLEKETK